MTPSWEALATVLGYVTQCTSLFSELLIATCLFAHGQQARPHVWARSAGAIATVFAAGFVLSSLVGAHQISSGNVFLLGADSALSPLPALGGALVSCTLLLLALIPAMLFCFEMSPWAAVFCATAGYALQNLASGIGEAAALVLDAAGLPGIVVGSNPWLTVGACAAVFAIAYLLFIRHIDPKGLEGHGNPAMLAMVFVVVFGIIGFDLILKYVVTGRLPMRIVLYLRAFHALICVFAIIAEVELVVVRQLASEKAATERLLAEQERQYQLSRDNIEAINIKCHDLRHQIRSLATGASVVDRDTLESVAKEIDVYDSKVRTGNDALDTILTEKSLLCEGRGITLTCVADGEALDFMAPADLYALFGNALDNAIEAVERIGDNARKSVSLIVRMRAGMVTVHVENYYDPVVSATSFRDGLPASTKGDPLNHGFGTRSMRAIVERYGGTLAFSADGSTFCLDAVIPARDARPRA
ncbi:GHKL domain-containing protein [Olsenella umbonata]|uniref:GHKL domain-containing protein n=1 Tax=Parafannyhessea umbonata TaxID=604330 RepID=A0A6N7WWT7_9ACTN|nr:GHKL domain-containing protein [Parafannyhessea umbonata]